MQIRPYVPDRRAFASKERNLHCGVHVTAENKHTLPPFGSLDSFWFMRNGGNSGGGSSGGSSCIVVNQLAGTQAVGHCWCSLHIDAIYIVNE